MACQVLSKKKKTKTQSKEWLSPSATKHFILSQLARIEGGEMFQDAGKTLY